MKKLALVVLMVALLLLSSLSVASATPPFGSEEPYTGGPPSEPGGGPWDFPTMVDRGFPCGFGPYAPTSWDSHAVMARPGFQTLVCVGEAYPAEVPERAVYVEEGFPCGLHFLGIYSYNSKLTITPQGKVIMTCHTEQSMHAE